MQNSLDKLEEDCKAVAIKITTLLAEDDDARVHNWRAASYGYGLLVLSLQPLVLALFYTMHRLRLPIMERARTMAPQLYALAISLGEALVEPPSPLAVAAGAGSTPAPGDEADPMDVTAGAAATAFAAQTAGIPEAALSMPQFLAAAAAVFLLLQFASRYARQYKPQFSSREASNLRMTREYVTGEMLERKRKLYKLYLEQCSSGVS